MLLRSTCHHVGTNKEGNANIETRPLSHFVFISFRYTQQSVFLKNIIIARYNVEITHQTSRGTHKGCTTNQSNTIEWHCLVAACMQRGIGTC
uniref:Uncharacterized protein n=1 Tax=Rhipicephalus zambeziensis TaxID=60191 RepID=A0A224YGV2_9ACAR